MARRSAVLNSTRTEVSREQVLLAKFSFVGRLIGKRLPLAISSDEKTEDSDKAPQQVSLRLSYMESPGNPDIYRVQDGQF